MPGRHLCGCQTLFRSLADRHGIAAAFAPEKLFQLRGGAGLSNFLAEE
jgi:hypothetical protein